MAYIFMDESGDLGFDFNKEGTSKNFMITCAISSSPRSLEKIIKKYFRSLPAKIRSNHCGTFHCNKEQQKYRDKIFSMINENNDCKIIVIRLNKEKVFTNLQEQKFILYNYIVNITLDRIINKKIINTSDTVTFIASQRETNRLLNENFKNYIAKKINEHHNLNIQTIVSHPSNHKGLQVVDACSWAVFRKYEYKDNSYYNIIKNHIIEDSLLFK